jgi:hypothetical protein
MKRRHRLPLATPQQPLTLHPATIEELHARLVHLRHNVNNQLSLIVAATELLRRDPSGSERMIATLTNLPRQIMEEIRSFSEHFESVIPSAAGPPWHSDRP